VIVFHIGFHKTATTTLQHHLMPRIEGCTVLGPTAKGAPGSGPELVRLMDELIGAEDGVYMDAPLRRLIEQARGDSATLVVSYEDLSLRTAGGRTSARLESLAPDAKVLIGVREQASALGARYGQYVKDGGAQRFAQYVANRPHDWLRYDLVVEEYQRRFGRDRVKVVAFEQLVRDETAFVREVAEFLTGRRVDTDDVGVLSRVNQTLAPVTRQVVRAANWLFLTTPERPRPPLRGLSIGPRAVRKLIELDSTLFPKMSRRLGRRDRELSARIALERCATGNARLVQLTGLPLGDYGYALSTGAHALG
jgi:hypothetical protein